MPCNPHRMTRTARTRSRKFSGRCESCGKPLCSCRAYQYTDENNGAITGKRAVPLPRLLRNPLRCEDTDGG